MGAVGGSLGLWLPVVDGNHAAVKFRNDMLSVSSLVRTGGRRFCAVALLCTGRLANVADVQGARVLFGDDHCGCKGTCRDVDEESQNSRGNKGAQISTTFRSFSLVLIMILIRKEQPSSPSTRKERVSTSYLSSMEGATRPLDVTSICDLCTAASLSSVRNCLTYRDTRRSICCAM